jgi:hypothetical protein
MNDVFHIPTGPLSRVGEGPLSARGQGEERGAL